MTTDDTKLQPGQARQAAKTTIVGGQPPGNQRLLSEVPVGLEQLLAMAAASEDFARALRQGPDSAIRASGLRLTGTERAVLGATPEPMVAKMIARVETLLPRPERRVFLERAAAALVVLVGGGALAACKGGKTGPGARSGGAAEPMDSDPMGTEPVDVPRPMETMRDHPPPGPPAGIRPDPLPPRPMDAMERPTDAMERPTDAMERPTDAMERPTDAMKRPMGSDMRPERPAVPQAGATIDRPMVPQTRPRPRDMPKSRGISHHRRNAVTGSRPSRKDDDL